jgi:hypothetical protein
VILSSPTTADTDGDGALDGNECVLGSAPGNSTGTGGAAFIGICVVTPACPVGPVAGPTGTGAVVGPAATSRPELKGDGVDNDLDGSGVDGDFGSANFDDTDSDGLPNWGEAALGTMCARTITGYAPTGTCFADARFNSDFDGDAVPGLFDLNSDGEGACGGWTSAAGYPIPAGAAGCDGPDYQVGNSPSQTNEDSDGMVITIRSTATGTRGSAGLTGFAFAGLGGCAAAEEAAFVPPSSDSNPRDFRDVNASGNVDGTDVALVKSGSGAVAGDGTARFKRTIDLNPAGASGGKGSGNIDGTDVALVKAQSGRSCAVAP